MKTPFISQAPIASELPVLIEPAFDGEALLDAFGGTR